MSPADRQARGGPARDDLEKRYAALLREYVSGTSEALTRADVLGSEALAAGVSVLDLVMLHHEALQAIHVGAPGEAPSILLAGRFLSESLSPFERALRALEENPRPLGLAETQAGRDSDLERSRDHLNALLDASVAIDVTEHRRSEEAVLRAKAAADSASRELESFSYSVAHDLREPLRSIDGFSQALLEDCAEQLDEQGAKYLCYVRESAQRMGQMIDDLLSLSRVSRGEIQVARVDLSALACRIAERLKETESMRDVEFVIEDGVTAAGDARLLQIALENLLDNAWKFTSKRPRARIEFGRMRLDDRSVNFVRDNGAGFDMTRAPKLFGPFRRLHSASEFPGRGIGLAIVERIVRRHGGRVWAEAAVDVGATLYFTLEEESRGR